MVRLLPKVEECRRTSVPCSRDGVCEPEGVRDDCAGLRVRVGGSDNVGVECEQVDDVVGSVFDEQVGVNERRVFGQDNVGVLSLHRCESDVGVLEVDTSVSLERGHLLHVEGVVEMPAARKEGEGRSAIAI